MLDRPFEHPHAAHRSADDGVPPFDAEVARERGLHRHLVADRDAGKARPVGLAVGRVGCGSRGALTAPEHVGAHREQAIGVDRRARADHAVPPSRVEVAGFRGPGCVAVTRERVEHEHRVRRVGSERAPRLVRHRHRRERAAGLERDRPVERDELPTPRLVTGAPRARDGHREWSAHVLAARNPASRSAWMSGRLSIPTDSRTRSSVTPVLTCSAASSCECVVVAGWIARLRTSPTFAR